MSASNSLSKNDLIFHFETILINSGFVIYSLKFDSESNFYMFDLRKEKKEFKLYVNLSNINEAYIPDKPFIKRRQVGAMDLNLIPQNTGNQISMLCGIKIVDENIVVCVWNPFYFTNHTKNRSCYVLESSIIDTLKNGTHFGVDCKNNIYLSDKYNFAYLLDEYIMKNRID